VFCVFPLCSYLVVSTSAIDCLERIVPGLLRVVWDVKPYTLTHLTEDIAKWAALYIITAMW